MVKIGIFMDILTSTKTDYNRWASDKLGSYTNNINNLMVEIRNPLKLSKSEKDKCFKILKSQNMVFFNIGKPQKNIGFSLQELARQFGMGDYELDSQSNETGLTKIQVETNKDHGEYIPYTNKPLNWHTDGYYNALDRKIKGMVLHCVSPAAKGGESALMDPEMAYILLRDENPDYIDALMRVDVMKIPANIENNNIIREAQNGPVFSLCDEKKYLHMRYTGRSHSVKWKNDRTATAAVEFLSEVLKSDSPYIHKHVFSGGEGVLSNNVLHKRAGFEDDTQRQRIFLRARYLDRIVI